MGYPRGSVLDLVHFNLFINYLDLQVLGMLITSADDTLGKIICVSPGAISSRSASAAARRLPNPLCE